MEYLEIINFLDNTPNQPCKCRTKNWAEITPLVKLNLKLQC